jgi:multisubunit Na+/H+ antiporter MnhF subunit
MITYVLYAAFGILTLAIVLGLLRLARGPTVIDRIMAFDLITTSAVGMIVLLAIQWRTALYLELILIFSLLGFFGTVAFVYYLSRTQDLESPTENSRPNKPAPTSDEPD